MIMLEGLSMTATWSKRNTTPKGGGGGGNREGIILLYLQDHQGSFSQLDYCEDIIHNWLVLCWVSTALWMCVYDKTITFQIARRVGSVFQDHHKCIETCASLSRLHWWAVKCVKGIKKGLCCWSPHSPEHWFSSDFSSFCNMLNRKTPKHKVGQKKNSF